MQVHRPDIVVKVNDIDHTWITNLAVPGDLRMVEKDKEKVGKYHDPRERYYYYDDFGE